MYGETPTMKTLNVTIPDEVYERAERRAVAHGAKLPDEVAEFVRRYGAESATTRLTGRTSGESPDAPVASQPETALAKLFAALDKSRNDRSVGRLNRNELYDRAVLR